jgi:hypothetical protein
MDETQMALTFWAQLFITVGCIGIVSVVIFCLVRDGYREWRDRRDVKERMQAVYKTKW